MACQMKVIIIGAGLGGLSCAIACAKQGLDVTVLERAPKFQHIGAGIQVTPNAVRVNRYLGTLPKLLGPGVVVNAINYRRFANGQVLWKRDNAAIDVPKFGAPWMVIHRADYLEILYETALAYDVQVRLGAEVSRIDFENNTVALKTEEIIEADVIVAADGLWSGTRDLILGAPSPPEETGDLAYRGTFTKAQLHELGDADIDQLCSKNEVNCWLGPGKHAVFYPLKNGEQYNLVLITPDNLPQGIKQDQGNIKELRDNFSGWDQVLVKLVSCLSDALKWKLCHHKELEAWTKGAVALLGDACHPTLPYQAQGAAMAVEDGTVLGVLLGRLNKSSISNTFLPDILKLYERLRKSRTTLIVAGAVSNQFWYHRPDGPEQEERDRNLAVGAQGKWSLNDDDYQMAMLGFDVVKDAEDNFEKWLLEKKNQIESKL